MPSKNKLIFTALSLSLFLTIHSQPNETKSFFKYKPKNIIHYYLEIVPIIVKNHPDKAKYFLSDKYSFEKMKDINNLSYISFLLYCINDPEYTCKPAVSGPDQFMHIDATNTKNKNDKYSMHFSVLNVNSDDLFMMYTCTRIMNTRDTFIAVYKAKSNNFDIYSEYKRPIIPKLTFHDLVTNEKIAAELEEYYKEPHMSLLFEKDKMILVFYYFKI